MSALRVHPAFAALGPMTWGTTYVVTTELLPPDRPLLAGLLRALPAGLLLLAIGRELPRGAWVARAILLGALNIGLFFALLFLAAERLPGGVAAMVGAIQPLLVAVLGGPLLGEAPGRVRIAAALAGAAGVALLVLRSDASLDSVGLLAAVGATVSMTLGTLLTKRWGRPAGLLSFTAWQLLAGAAILLPATLAVEGLPSTITTNNAAGFAYLTLVGTAGAYLLWFWGLGRMAASAAALLPLLSPVVALAVGVAYSHEAMTLPQAAGALLVLGAVLLGVSRGTGAPARGARRRSPAVGTAR
ncbi:MAG: putative blue pigment (indigoidine) exporter [Baekduia sp.]|jgi:probable blue pigment (indigoidine) exporter|nr:putative blue pigment (indigoidine) exporter [Baekduia sp.]MDX6703941.1 putative blue pigment (indigoidine) exporter [Baekduia sp.]